jgi:hypothetical protein
VPGADDVSAPVSTSNGEGSKADGYVWFEDVRVFLDGLQLMCAVGDKVVPLPVVILHPECTLSGDGDVGRLGVPRQWAKDRGLVAN